MDGICDNANNSDGMEFPSIALRLAPRPLDNTEMIYAATSRSAI